MLIGDMAIKNLAPRDANSGGRIIKNMRVCGSGLYEYATSEAELMGLVIPGDYRDPTFFIFRSPEVLEANKDLYARVPIITGRHVRVNTANAKRFAVGMVGDTVQSEVGDDGETYLYTTGTIITEDGIAAYEQYGELSVGYDPIVEWAPGVYKGKPYQAVLKGFNEINHLLICKTARGGHQCMIYDEKGFYPEATVFIMTGEKIKSIFNFLCSEIGFFVFSKYYMGPVFDSTGFRYKKEYLMELPIPKLDENLSSTKYETTLSKVLNLTREELEYINSYKSKLLQ